MSNDTDFDYRKLDDMIHSRIRLAIMSVLIAVGDADFNFLKDKTNATDGNLSVHLKKLEDAGYVEITKKFVKRKPVTKAKLTDLGKQAFSEYIKNLEKLIIK